MVEYLLSIPCKQESALFMDFFFWLVLFFTHGNSSFQLI